MQRAVKTLKKNEMRLAPLLRRFWQKKKSERKGFSIRVAARHVKIAPSVLSEILNGKRLPNPDALDKLLRLLDVEAERVVEARMLLAFDKGLVLSGTSAENRVIGNLDRWSLQGIKNVSYLRHWFYPAVLECTLLKNYDGTATFIANTLAINVTSVEIAMRELLACGLLIADDSATMRKNEEWIRFAASTSKEDIRSFHNQMLIQAQLCLKETDDEAFAKRLISGITISGSQAQIEWAKARLAQCLHEIANELSVGDADCIYHLAAQLFPLSQD